MIRRTVHQAPGAAVGHTHSGAYARLGEPSLLKPTVALAESIFRGFKADTIFPLLSGRLQLQAIALPSGLLVSSISWISGSTALGTPTNQWSALFDNTRTKLAISADGTSTAW